MKNGLMIGLFLCWAALNSKEAFAEFTMTVTTTRDSASVPVGDVTISVVGGAGNSFNSGGQIGTSSWNTLSVVDVQVKATPLPIKVTVQKATVVQGNDLIVNSTFRPQTIVQSYSRKDTGGAVWSVNPLDNFTVNQNFNIAVNFALAANSNAAEYQFYFVRNDVPAEDAMPPFTSSPDFVSTNPQSTMVIPWSVVQHIGTGNNLYAVLRAVDFQGRVSNGVFEFDITPMGGGAAVPEPSTWWAIGIIASGYAGRTGWKRWRQKRSQREREIEGAAR